MRLHILYDDSGCILAAVKLGDESSPPVAMDGKPIPAPCPLPESGQYTADVKVPDEFNHLNFVEICSQLVVQCQGASVQLEQRKRD